MVHKPQKIKSCSSHATAIVIPVEPVLMFLSESFQTLPGTQGSWVQRPGISSVTVSLPLSCFSLLVL